MGIFGLCYYFYYNRLFEILFLLLLWPCFAMDLCCYLACLCAVILPCCYYCYYYYCQFDQFAFFVRTCRSAGTPDLVDNAFFIRTCRSAGTPDLVANAFFIRTCRSAGTPDFGGRARYRDRQRDRQIERYRDRCRDRQIERYCDRQIDDCRCCGLIIVILF